jgi:hypothetical protein
MATAREPSDERGVRGSSNYALPAGAAAIEIAVPIPYTEFDLVTASGGAGNLIAPGFCGWDFASSSTKEHIAYCPGSTLYNLAAGCTLPTWGGVSYPVAFIGVDACTSPARVQQACENFVEGMTNVAFPESYVGPLSVALFNGETKEKGNFGFLGRAGVNSAGGDAFEFLVDAFPWTTTTPVAFSDVHGSVVTLGFAIDPSVNSKASCPQAGSQTAAITGTDYYYALFNPALNQHTIVVITDATIDAASTGTLFVNDATNGVGNGYPCALCVFGTAPSESLKETAWTLGHYSHTLSLSGPYIGASDFGYQFNQSTPNATLVSAEYSSGTADTVGISVGVMGDAATGSISGSETWSTNVSAAMSAWQVVPTPGESQITYDWTTQLDGASPTPVALSWTTIVGCTLSSGPVDGCGASFTPNTQNIGDFGPASQTVWAGAPTYGPVKIASARSLSFVDHYSLFSTALSNDPIADYFHITNLPFSDDPNAAVACGDPVVPGAPCVKTSLAAVGPGLNLCDGAVMDPDFLPECAQLYPTLVTDGKYVGGSSTKLVPSPQYGNVSGNSVLSAVQLSNTTALTKPTTLTGLTFDVAASSTTDTWTGTIGVVAGGSWAPSALTCTIPVGSTSCTVTANVKVSAGQSINMEVFNTGGQTQTTGSWTITYTQP